MKKPVLFLFITLYVISLAACQKSDKNEPSASTVSPATEDSAAGGTAADYPAAIMVDGSVYLLSAEPMSEEVDESAVIGYTKSYTNNFPEKNGETNFNRALDMPYAKVENGIAVYYEEEWYLCTPEETGPSN